MKKSRFTDSQILEALKRAEAGLAVPELCRELGISSATFYKWRSKYGGMDASMMSRMKELEAENARLRKMYIEEKLKAEIESPRDFRRLRRLSQAGMADSVCCKRYCISNSAGGTFPMGSSSRRLLNQSTHSKVAYSTSSRFLHGPRW